jgi:hypothetical protein
MYGFRKTEGALQGKMQTITDPEDPSENPQPIFSDVLLAKPINLELFNGPIVILKLSAVPTIKPAEIGEPVGNAIFNGGAFIFIPGDDEEAARLCKHYTDILGAFLRINELLWQELPGCIITMFDNQVHDFKIVNVDPKNTKTPRKSTASATFFTVSKPLEPPVIMKIPDTPP